MIWKLISQYRLRIKKEDPDRWREKFAITSITKPDNLKVIWIHAVSLGEAFSSLELIKQFTENNYFVLLTTTTLSSMNAVKNKLPINAVHQFAPWPSSCYIKKFLNFWQIEKAIFIESEIWPSYVNQCYKRKIKTFIVNAGMSDNSYKLWCLISFYSKSIFSKYTTIFARSKNEQEKFQNLGAKDVRLENNIKFDYALAFKKESEVVMLNKINNYFLEQFILGFSNKKKVVIFASTHPKEEQIALNVINKLFDYDDSIFPIIAIRHCERRSEVRSIFEDNKNFNVILFSEWSCNYKKYNICDNKKPVFIVDQIGFLSFFYNISDVVVMCGSLVPNIGGHNPLEPAILKKPTIIGKFHSNCLSIVQDMLENNAIMVAQNSEDLFVKIINIISGEKNIGNTLSENAYHFVTTRTGVCRKIFSQIAIL
jgi:3-deoxy-D-manno-octulosonic-acid transferase